MHQFVACVCAYGSDTQNQAGPKMKFFHHCDEMRRKAVWKKRGRGASAHCIVREITKDWLAYLLHAQYAYFAYLLGKYPAQVRITGEAKFVASLSLVRGFRGKIPPPNLDCPCLEMGEAVFYIWAVLDARSKQTGAFHGRARF